MKSFCEKTVRSSWKTQGLGVVASRLIGKSESALTHCFLKPYGLLLPDDGYEIDRYASDKKQQAYGCLAWVLDKC
jgi:hypothetical protein